LRLKIKQKLLVLLHLLVGFVHTNWLQSSMRLGIAVHTCNPSTARLRLQDA
jgi:hypothetical protein